MYKRPNLRLSGTYVFISSISTRGEDCFVYPNKEFHVVHHLSRLSCYRCHLFYLYYLNSTTIYGLPHTFEFTKCPSKLNLPSLFRYLFSQLQCRTVNGL